MIPERPVTLDAGAGLRLEAMTAAPPGACTGVVICHPHPLYGGDMANPVVRCLTEAAAQQGLATLRFNFRGVGASTGVHDAGRGERDDVAAAMGFLRSTLGPGARIALAGYSFGAAIAAACARPDLAGLALVAPPFRSQEPPGALVGGLAAPVLLLAGAEDEYCPRAALERLAQALPKAEVRVLAGVDHFFTNGLDRVAAAVRAWAATVAAAR